MPIEASPLSRLGVQESVEDIASTEATLSSMDFLAVQRESRKLIFDKLQESQRKAPDSPGKEKSEKDFRAAQQQAQEIIRTAQQQGREGVLLAQERAIELLRKAERQAQEPMQEPDVYLNIVTEHYEELLRVSSAYVAVAEKDQAIAEKDQAIADKNFAIAGKERAMAEEKPASTVSSSRPQQLLSDAMRWKEVEEASRPLISGDSAQQPTCILVLHNDGIPAEEVRQDVGQQPRPTTLVLQHHMCPPIASFPLRRFDGLQPQANLTEGHETRSIVRRVSCDGLHLAKSNERGTEYWFRDVVHGTVRGDTNIANVDAVMYEVISLVLAGIELEQLTILVWSEAQVDLVTSELLKRLWRDTPTRGVLPIAVVYLMDFGYCESDVIIADLVVADAATDHGEATTRAGIGQARAAAEPSKDLVDRVRNSANLRIGLTRARYGLVVIGQASWLTRRPRYNSSGEEERDHAEMVHDAERRKLYIRDQHSS